MGEEERIQYACWFWLTTKFPQPSDNKCATSNKEKPMQSTQGDLGRGGINSKCAKLGSDKTFSSDEYKNTNEEWNCTVGHLHWIEWQALDMKATYLQRNFAYT